MRVLVARAGALGDLLLLRPTLASLRAAPVRVTLLAPERPADAVRAEADALVPWDRADVARLIGGDVGVAEAQRILEAPDVVVAYSRSRELIHGLRPVCGRVIVHDPDPRGEHAADWLAGPLREIGVPRIDPGPCGATAAELAFARPWWDRLPPRFLAIHPGSGSARKNWPPDRFAELVRRVSPDRGWLLSLGPADESASSLVEAPGAVVTRDLPPRALGALLSGAGVYVGNDSGVSHLAAAWGAPTLALFGPTDPAVWSPLGPRAHTIRAPTADMASLTVEAVVRALSTIGY